MVESENSCDKHKTLKISIGVVIKKIVPDHLKPISTIIGISPQTFLTFSFNPFATLV